MFVAAVLLASGSLVAKAAGLLNQIVVSSQFGAGAEMDAYFAVLAVPVFMSGFLSSILTNTVVPIYVDVKGQHGPAAAQALMRALLTLTLLFTGATSVLLVVGTPLVTRAFAPGLSSPQLATAYQIAPYIYPVLAVNTVLAVITAGINAEGQFGGPAYLAVVVPIAMTGSTLLWRDWLGVRALAIGLIAGSLIQLALTLGFALRHGIRYRPTLRLTPPGIGRVLGSIPTLALGVTIVQTSPIVDQIVASSLPIGSLSAINFSLKIIDIPVVILFMTMSRILLPHFSSLASSRDHANLRQALRRSIWIMSTLAFGTSAILVVFSQPIVRLFYHRGAFNESAVEMTAGALVGFALGLVPMGIGFIVPRVFNAIGQNGVLARLAFVTLVLNFSLDVVLSRYFLHVGIALSTSLTYTVTTVTMLVILQRHIGKLGLIPRRLPASTAPADSRVAVGAASELPRVWVEDDHVTAVQGRP